MASNVREEELQILKNNIQLLYEQRELLNLFNVKGIPSLVIGDSLTALSYPNPLSRELFDIDLLLHSECFEKAVSLCHENGYLPFKLPEDHGNCAHFIKNGITIHLLIEMKVFREEHKNQLLNTWITSEKPLIARIGNDTIPTMQQWLNGILQLALLQTDAQRGRIKMQSLIDWMMFAKDYLCDKNWGAFEKKANLVGLTEFSKTITSYGKRYVDINAPWCDGALEISDDFVVDTRRTLFHDEFVKTGRLAETIKQALRSLYRAIKQSPFRGVFHYLNDIYFALSAKMQGRPYIKPEDIANVENNVSFNFKSFNRQKQAKRLYNNIKEYYPNAKVIIADDSSQPLELPGVIHLPFNSGLSKGLQAALDEVNTPYVVRLDDDMLLTPKTNFHEQLKFLEKHPEVDLVAVMADHKHPREYALKFSKIRMGKKLLIPAGTMIDDKEVVYKAPNCFIARTEKLRLVGYDTNIRIHEHHEFFSRAAGSIVCVLDPNSYIMHCHNMFEGKEYDNFRYDVEKSNQYVRGKHVSKYQ